MRNTSLWFWRQCVLVLLFLVLFTSIPLESPIKLYPAWYSCCINSCAHIGTVCVIKSNNGLVCSRVARVSGWKTMKHSMCECVHAQSECFHRVLLFHFRLAPPFTIYAQEYEHAASNNPFANTRCTPYTINMLRETKPFRNQYRFCLFADILREYDKKNECFAELFCIMTIGWI